MLTSVCVLFMGVYVCTWFVSRLQVIVDALGTGGARPVVIPPEWASAVEASPAESTIHLHLLL